MRTAAAIGVGLAVGLSLAAPAVPASARPSDPGVVNYAVMGKGSVGNIIGAPMRFDWTFTDPFQSYYVDDPVCNNWADIGLTRCTPTRIWRRSTARSRRYRRPT